MQCLNCSCKLIFHRHDEFAQWHCESGEHYFTYEYLKMGVK